MSQPGIGAMLYLLGGGSPKDPVEYYGRTIKTAALEGDVFYLEFEDGTGMKLWDNGQSCCEHRYITCDDDLQKLVGGVLKEIQTKEGPTQDAGYDCHEQAFVEIQTDNCFVTVCTHNEHNGYYGGFGLCVEDYTP